ncbi:transposase [Candidatus Woesearchaeota archaeon]|nr:transposase [Candidatus Woesearchaeota archaeon]
MIIYGSVLPGAATIARSAFLVASLTERAKYKMKVLDWYKNHGNNISLTARHFGLGRATLHRWIKRFKHYGITGLNEKSRRPKNTRKPETSWLAVMRIVQLRKMYPAWSKYKIKALLEKENIQLSASTVGRIIKRKNLINKKVSRKRRKASLSPKARFPHGLRISEPGDMVQMDVKHIMLPGGKKLYQFTAIDVLTKQRALRVYPSESSKNGSLFLKECLACFPFPVKAIQTDNGSSFLKEFDKLCQELPIPHYFTYPRNPKQNSYVEISHEADKKEFYQQGNACSLLPVMQRKIKEWEDIWNNVRPHQALDYLTPSEYLRKVQNSRIPTRDVIVLQT